jgi:hypothetical protein
MVLFNCGYIKNQSNKFKDLRPQNQPLVLRKDSMSVGRGLLGHVSC